MNDDKIQSAISRKARAEALLRDELLIEAWAKVDKEYIDLWKRTADPVQRERCWMATQIAERVQAVLRAVIMDGKIAEVDLASLIAAKEAA